MDEALPNSGLEGIQLTTQTSDAAAMNFADAACVEVRQFAISSRSVVPSDDQCRRVRNAILNAAARDAVSMEALRRAVCDFTTALRDDGATPEAMLIALKAVVGNRTEPLPTPHPSDSHGFLLAYQISTWSIQEFFRPTSG